MFLGQFFNYGLITLGFLAIVRSQILFLLGEVTALFSYLVVRKVAESTSSWLSVPYALGGASGTIVAMWLAGQIKA